MSVRKRVRLALRDRVLPMYGPTDPGDPLEVWHECVRAIVPEAKEEDINEAILYAVLDGLMRWDSLRGEYRRAVGGAA